MAPNLIILLYVYSLCITLSVSMDPKDSVVMRLTCISSFGLVLSQITLILFDASLFAIFDMIKQHSCIDIYVHSCLKLFSIG